MRIGCAVDKKKGKQSAHFFSLQYLQDMKLKQLRTMQQIINNDKKKSIT